MARVLEIGERPYLEVWELQKELVAKRIANEVEDTIILCSHPAVYTVGRRKDALKNLLNIENTPVYEIERGGDVTWHGPGQWVAYPVVRMPDNDVLKHLRVLEEIMMVAARDACGLTLSRDPRNAGVWVNGHKVGSVGVASRQSVTWHGLALNVNPDLSWFRRINPCGMDAMLLSSLKQESKNPVDANRVYECLKEQILTYWS